MSLVFACFSLPASAQQMSLASISNYLNGITSAQSTFTQINADGTISTGTISISRPGKIRFDYNPPEKALVIATRGAVFILDRKLRAEPEVYPLRQTPLSIILARNVNLTNDGMVTGHSYDGTATTVTAQDPKHPNYGSIQMKFTNNPPQLRQWIIDDGNGSETTVILGALEEQSLSNKLFDIDGEVAALK